MRPSLPKLPEADPRPPPSRGPAGTTQRPNNRAPYARHVVVVTSGKGGVGKSTVAVNLASALAQRDFAVGVLDADVYGPSVPRLLQLHGERMHWNEQDRIVPLENFGLKVMSVGFTTPKDDTPLIWRSSVATNAMIQLLDDVAWGPLDFLIIDMPPGTGDTQLTMAQELRISAALVVTTPQVLATDDAARAVRMLQEIHAPIGGVVENMSPYVVPDTGLRCALFGEGGGRALARAYGLPLLAEIPFDSKVRVSGDQGTPIAVTGSSRQRAPFEAIADGLLQRLGNPRPQLTDSP